MSHAAGVPGIVIANGKQCIQLQPKTLTNFTGPSRAFIILMTDHPAGIETM